MANFDWPETPAWKKNVYYPCYRFVRKLSPKRNYQNIKWFIQRGRRGWADCDWWNLDYRIYSTLPPMLRELARNGLGLPYEYIPENASDDQHEEAGDRWKRDLLKAANDIEAYFKMDELPQPDDEKERAQYYQNLKKSQEQTRRGMHFVADNLFSLWD